MPDYSEIPANVNINDRRPCMWIGTDNYNLQMALDIGDDGDYAADDLEIVQSSAFYYG